MLRAAASPAQDPSRAAVSLRACGAVAFEQITEARQQFSEREGFSQVIVTALFEPAHTVINRSACGKNQYRGFHAQLTQAKDQSDSILVRQPKIDDENVEWFSMASRSADRPSDAASTSYPASSSERRRKL